MVEAPLHPLRRWRLSQGLTLDAAAAGVGTYRGTWNDWETGRRIPDRNYMPKVWAFTRFAVEPNDFFQRPDPHQEALPLEADAAFDLPPRPAPLLAAVEREDQAALEGGKVNGEIEADLDRVAEIVDDGLDGAAQRVAA